MHSLSDKYLSSLSFNSEQASILRAIGEYRGKQALFFKQSPETLETLRMVAKIESSESSNRLEGIELPHKKIEELVLKDTAPISRSEQEIAGYRDALNLIHESGEHMPFTTNVVLQLHGILCRYLSNPGGKWKSNDNEIIETHPDGTKRVRFVPTKAFLTPTAMNQLTNEYSNAVEQQKLDAIILVPLAILDFLCIHPFTDGNGRMSRLLTLLLLYQFDYQVGHYISLERIFEDSKESYYETLETSSKDWHEEKHDINPWLNYFWGTLLRAYREFEERVGIVSTNKGSKTELIRNTINRRIEPFSIGTIESDCPGISREMIRIVLRQMRDEGTIKAIGKGRGALWQKV
ncbi:MAG TPA: Fic family protein [Gammaproteobacteria bacterium]|nr:Fic family protein [Gammaproteobacteria bacterium]